MLKALKTSLLHHVCKLCSLLRQAGLSPYNPRSWEPHDSIELISVWLHDPETTLMSCYKLCGIFSYTQLYNAPMLVHTHFSLSFDIHIHVSGNWNFADASGFVRQWHVSTGQCLWTTDEKRHTLAAAISPTATTFSTAGSDNEIFLYDLVTHEKVHSFKSR